MKLDKRIEKLEANKKPARLEWNLSSVPTEDLLKLRDLKRTDPAEAKEFQLRLMDEGLIFMEARS